MKLNHLRWQVIRPALKVLEDVSGKPLMGHTNAEHLLLAIALQESNARHRWQIKGPARGYWQFEKYGGCKGVLEHRSTRGHAAALLEEIDIHTTLDAAWEALPFSELLQAGFARLLLWTHPHPLPAPVNASAAWTYYLNLWRPGRPGPDRWVANYQMACKLCEDLA